MEPHRVMERPSVLVVDDYADLRFAVARVFREAGFRVADAANGLEALTYLENNGAVCAIILDLEMPVMSGWDFITACRKHPMWKDIPIVVLTALAPAYLVSELLNGLPVFTKPCDSEDLITAVRRAMFGPAPFCGVLEKG